VQLLNTGCKRKNGRRYCLKESCKIQCVTEKKGAKNPVVARNFQYIQNKG